MHGPAHLSSNVILGLSPLVVALTVFVLTHAVIVTERINRAIVALLGAGVMVLTGVLHQHEAIAGIDFNTIGLLTGMMVIMAITQKSGVFQYGTVKSAKLVKADPWLDHRSRGSGKGRRPEACPRCAGPTDQPRYLAFTAYDILWAPDLVVAGFAERAGTPIRFLPFMLAAFPLMLASIAVSRLYIGWRHF